MSDKTTKQTKAELLEMLAEAVRNTQPQVPVGAAQPEPVRDAPRKRKRNMATSSKPAGQSKKARASGKPKRRGR